MHDPVPISVTLDLAAGAGTSQDVKLPHGRLTLASVAQSTAGTGGIGVTLAYRKRDGRGSPLVSGTLLNQGNPIHLLGCVPDISVEEGDSLVVYYVNPSTAASTIRLDAKVVPT